MHFLGYVWWSKTALVPSSSFCSCWTCPTNSSMEASPLGFTRSSDALMATAWRFTWPWERTNFLWFQIVPTGQEPEFHLYFWSTSQPCLKTSLKLIKRKKTSFCQICGRQLRTGTGYTSAWISCDTAEITYRSSDPEGATCVDKLDLCNPAINC